MSVRKNALLVSFSFLETLRAQISAIRACVGLQDMLLRRCRVFLACSSGVPNCRRRAASFQAGLHKRMIFWFLMPNEFSHLLSSSSPPPRFHQVKPHMNPQSQLIPVIITPHNNIRLFSPKKLLATTVLSLLVLLEM